MNSNQVAQLVNGGHEVGSHSLSHPRLLDISEAQLTKELVDSKNILSSIVGANIKSFSYPFGRTNSSIVQATAKYYQLAYMAFLTSDNPGNSKHMINRVEIDGKVSDSELEIKAQHEHNFLKLT
jgi:peptidoglycan/xylan/chitin deacetylase (PgdA/CDA1 family)